MLKFEQKEKLEIVEQYLRSIKESPEFKSFEYYPDVTLGDCLQGLNDLIDEVYEQGYQPWQPPTPEQKAEIVARIKHENRFRPLRVLRDVALGVGVPAIFASGFLALSSFFCMGVSGMDKATNDRLSPQIDWMASGDFFRGAAGASLAVGGISILTAVASELEASRHD